MKQQNETIEQKLKNIILTIVSELVSKPEEIKIHIPTTASLIVYEIEANPNDVKYIIGEKGTNIQSLRCLLRSIAKKNGKNIQIDVIQPQKIA